MAKIPVSLVTGFLGSGKTSFLKEFLSSNNQSGIALIINELGEVALDQRILKTALRFEDEKMLYLNSGCVCCNKRLDLKSSLKSLLESYEKEGKELKHIIIESTGLALPAPILWTLLSDAFLSSHFSLQTVISCVDVLNGFLHLQNEEARQQIIASDLVLLTKTDLKEDNEELKDKLLSLNPSLLILDKSKLNYKELFAPQNKLHTSLAKINSFEIQSKQETHTDGFDSLALGFCGSVEWSAFGIWLSALLHKYGTQIMRVKGLLDIGEDFLISVNGVGHIIHTPTHIKKDEELGSKLVLITRKLEKKRLLRSLQAFKSLLKTEFVILG